MESPILNPNTAIQRETGSSEARGTGGSARCGPVLINTEPAAAEPHGTGICGTWPRSIAVFGLNSQARQNRWTVGLAFAGLLGLTVLLLRGEGRSWWCACGGWNLWVSDIWSDHCSQHFLDAYSFSHVLHGVVFCLAGWLALPKVRFAWKLWMSTLLECGWEVLENSNFIIQRYRAVTISLGYEGDSILNALSDVGCCMLGFGLAQRLGLRRSLIVFAVTEVVMLITIRDNLTLNVIMLIYPVEAIKAWQMVH